LERQAIAFFNNRSLKWRTHDKGRAANATTKKVVGVKAAAAREKADKAAKANEAAKEDEVGKVDRVAKPDEAKVDKAAAKVAAVANP
jgi:hypothetical protein